MEGFHTDIPWGIAKNIDGLFTLCGAFDVPKGHYLEIASRDAIPGIAKYGRVLHPEFPAFCRTSSNYVGVGGRSVSMFRWLPEQDDYVRQLEENMDDAPLTHMVLHTSIDFIWESRTIIRVSDCDLLPKRVWYQNSVEWGLDMLTRFESVDNLSLVCMMSEELYDWDDWVYKMDAGDVVEIAKEGSEMYLASLGGSVSVERDSGTTVLENLDAAKIVSDSITVTALEDVMLMRRVR